MHQPPPPNSRDLLLPLLACLPASFASPKPPPALIPLLSPLLRQRVNFLSTGGNGSEGWLPLLSWDQQRGAQLPGIVERMDLEPHPVSGELELEEVSSPRYRRLDPETLHARLEVAQFDLLPIYLWCESDEHGNTGPGWKLAELKSLDDKDDGEVWFESQGEANDAATSRGPAAGNGASVRNGQASQSDREKDNNDDDNDDYWASYDRTPGRTPAQNLTPGPPPSSAYQTTHWSGSKSESEYYDRYGSEVQPALDAHDPDEEMDGFHESTLTGDSLFQHAPTQPQPQNQINASETRADLSMPRPMTPASSHSSIDKLEAEAAAMNAAEDRAQLGIKQHISTDIKSLFRLAKSAGMERAEFERIVKTELDVLSLLEQDE